MTFRVLRLDETDFLKEMFYEALYVPEGHPPYPKSVVDKPELVKYTKDWGTGNHDIAIVAEQNGKLVGAIWGRTFQPPEAGYGFVDEHTPEISMAVKKDYRGNGIGAKLIDAIANAYAVKGIQALSLSVDKENRARNLYERVGFTIVEEAGTAVTMKKTLQLNKD